MLTIYKCLVRPCMEYASHVWGGFHTHTQLSWTEWSEKLFVSSTPLLLLTAFCLLISAAVLLHFLSFIIIFMLTVLLNLLTACLHFSRSLAAQDIPLKLTSLLSKFLIRELTSIFSPSVTVTGKLRNSLPLTTFPSTYDLIFFQKGSIKPPLNSILIMLLTTLWLFLFYGAAARGLFFLSLFLLCPWVALVAVKKKKLLIHGLGRPY